MATHIQQNLISKNADYVSSFEKGSLALPPSKEYLVVTCMDARIDPAAAFGIDLGDAHIIRNAGANARDSLRSIVISQQLLGTKEILLVKHTGCGMLTFGNEDARAIIENNLGSHIKPEVEALDFQPFPELEQAVKEDVTWLRGQNLVVPDIPITGWVYEVETGRVRQIV